MPYRVKGTVDSECRILLLNEDGTSLERSSIFSAGDWELLAVDDELRIVVSRETTSGEAYAFSGVIPEYYEDPDALLAINSLGDILAIDGDGNGLIVSTT